MLCSEHQKKFKFAIFFSLSALSPIGSSAQKKIANLNFFLFVGMFGLVAIVPACLLWLIHRWLIHRWLDLFLWLIYFYG